MLKFSCRPFAAAVFVLAVAVACTKASPPADTHQIRAAGLLADQNLAPADKAEQLAKTAEQLLTVQGFAYADNVADLALASDATNVRAQFIKALLAPIMATKGSLTRLAPIAAKDEQLQSHYDDIMAQVDALTPNSTAKTFLLDGRADIATESDLQAYWDGLSEGFEVMRQFAKAHKDQTLTIMASDTFYGALQKRWEDSCEVIQTNPYEWHYNCPPQINMMEITLSRGDFEALEEIAAGLELYYALPNSYDLSGAFAVAMAHRREVSPAAEGVVTDLLSSSAFGQLRATNSLHRIREMGLDAVLGVRWVMNNQDSLCPAGYATNHNRIGTLFSEGLCMDQSHTVEVARGLRQAQNILDGATVPYTYRQGSDWVSTVMRPIAISETPIADLHSLAPVSFDSCGHLLSIADSTLGGLFPQGDFNKILGTPQTCATSSQR